MNEQCSVREVEYEIISIILERYHLEGSSPPQMLSSSSSSAGGGFVVEVFAPPNPAVDGALTLRSTNCAFFFNIVQIITHLSIRGVIWILASDTQYLSNSINIHKY